MSLSKTKSVGDLSPFIVGALPEIGLPQVSPVEVLTMSYEQMELPNI